MTSALVFRNVTSSMKSTLAMQAILVAGRIRAIVILMRTWT